MAWQSSESSGNDDSPYSIQAQRFASDGSPIGEQFQVNSYTTNNQGYTALDFAADRSFVVVWSSTGSPGTDSSGNSVQGQRFAANGTTQGGEFQVNSYTTNNQAYPAVGVSADGNFVVVWQSTGSSGTDSSGNSVQGQRYDSDGLPAGTEFQVNTSSFRSQGHPRVGVFPEGAFVVAWDSYDSSGTDNNYQSIQGQLFAADGSPVGGEFQVNSYTTYTQTFPIVGVSATGEFVVAWQSYGSSGTDSDDLSMQAQRFEMPLFADGFETGDTSAWSSSLP